MSEDLFDRAAEYDAMLDRGLRLSGEDKHFFIAGRIDDLRRQLPNGWTPRRILDFGCGIGDATRTLAEAFPRAEAIGVDTAARALDHARKAHGSSRVSFASVDALATLEPFDLCYTNGVFHHIEPGDRHAAAATILRALGPGGHFALFENNPWNPGTRLVMSRIPFDRDARMLSAREARRLLAGAGFQSGTQTRFLFYFPRPLAFLRFAEPRLAPLPFGAQYYVLARR